MCIFLTQEFRDYLFMHVENGEGVDKNDEIR